MGSEIKTDKHGLSYKKDNQHRKNFTEGLMNNDAILKALNIKAGQTILDAGCGTGYMSRLFSREAGPSGKVYTMDKDKYFLKILKQETQGTNMVILEGDITRPTRIKESSIDLIFTSTVIHSFSRVKMHGFLQEIKRLLKPCGLLAIVELEKKRRPSALP